MTPGILSVYRETSNEILDFFSYYETTQLISEQTSYTIASITEGTDPIAGDYVMYALEPEELGLILSERDINVAFKYTATINDTYSGLTIIEHTTDGIYDYIKVIGVPSVVTSGTDEATTISLMLINSIYISTYPYQVNNFSPRKNCIFSGEQVDIQISTKFDLNRTRLQQAQKEVLSLITKNHRKFDIYEGSDFRGYYKLMELPSLSGYINDGNNQQQITISLKGYYLMSY